MHPILEDRRRLALYLLAWMLVGMLLAVGLRSDSSWTTSAAFLLPLCFVYAFIGLSTWYLCRAFPIGGRSSWSTLIVVQSIAAVAASAMWTALGYFWAGALDGLGGGLVPTRGRREEVLLRLGPLERALERHHLRAGALRFGVEDPDLAVHLLTLG